MCKCINSNMFTVMMKGTALIISRRKGILRICSQIFPFKEKEKNAQCHSQLKNSSDEKYTWYPNETQGVSPIPEIQEYHSSQWQMWIQNINHSVSFFLQFIIMLSYFPSKRYILLNLLHFITCIYLLSLLCIFSFPTVLEREVKKKSSV